MLSGFVEPNSEEAQRLRLYARQIICGERDVYDCFGVQKPVSDFRQTGRGMGRRNDQERLAPAVKGYAAGVALNLYFALGFNPNDAVQELEKDAHDIAVQSGMDLSMATYLVVTYCCQHAAARLNDPRAMFALAGLAHCSRNEGRIQEAEDFTSFLRDIPDTPSETPLSRDDLQRFRKSLRTHLANARRN